MANVGVIFLGFFAEADTDENDADNENDGVYAGTHDNTVLQAITINVTEPDNDGVAYDDDFGDPPSEITYDIGGGNVTANQDSVAVYNVSILLGDGSTINTVANLIQLTNGATFLNENSSGAALDNLAIQSITIGSVVEDNATGWFTTRSVDNASIACFVSGAMIATPGGSRAVETLSEGDLVLTGDRGPQPIIWRAQEQAPGYGATAPIAIEKGALGPEMPRQRLLLSRQHRVLIRSPIAHRMYGQHELFVSAHGLQKVPGCTSKGFMQPCTFHHLMLAEHAILMANGLPVESFLPGPEAIRALSVADRERLRACLERHGRSHSLCRPQARGRKLERLLARHLKNGKMLCDPRPRMDGAFAS